MKKLVWLLCLVISMVMSGIALATPPSIPSKNMEMQIDINGTPALGSVVEVVFTFTLRDSIHHHGNATDTAWIEFPQGARLVSGQTSWTGRLATGETETITARFSLDSNMVFSLGGFVLSEGVDLSLLPPEIAAERESGEYGFQNIVGSQTYIVGDVPPVRNTQHYSVVFGDRDSTWTGEIPLDSVPIKTIFTPQGEELIVSQDGTPMLLNDTLFIKITGPDIRKFKQTGQPIVKGIKADKAFFKIMVSPLLRLSRQSVHISSARKDSVSFELIHNSVLLKKTSIQDHDTIDVKIDSLSLRLISDKADGYQIWGTFDYIDNFGNSQPVRYCDVHLSHEDGGIYYLDAVTQTLDNGYFQVYCYYPNNLVAVISSNDAASTVFAADHRPSVGDILYAYGQGILGYNHYQDYEIPSQYTTISAIEKTGSWNICNIGLFGSDYISNIIAPMDEAYYCWDQLDATVTNSSFGGNLGIGNTPLIYIDAYTGINTDNDRDEWDSIIVLHEMSHLVMYRFASLAGPNYTPHYYDYPDISKPSEVLKSGAYKESWANFLASAMLYPETHPTPRFFARNKDNNFTHRYYFERPEPDVPFIQAPQNGPTNPTPLYEGANVEGAIIVALRDIFDNLNDGAYYQNGQLWGHNNDYNSSDYWRGIDAIWDVFSNFDPRPNDASYNYCRTIYDFVGGWRTMGYPVEGHFRDIMEAHNVAVFFPGDADGNGIVTITDSVFLINYIFAGGPRPLPVLAQADTDGNCSTDIGDAVFLINYIFAGGTAPVPGCS